MSDKATVLAGYAQRSDATSKRGVRRVPVKAQMKCDGDIPYSARVPCVSGDLIRAGLFWALPSPRTSKVKQTKTLSGRITPSLGNAREPVGRLPLNECPLLARCVRDDMALRRASAERAI